MVLAQVVGLVDRVELDRRVEVGEDHDQRALEQQVGPVRGREVRVDEALRLREELADRRRERHDRGREDDRDDAGHVHAQRHVGRAARGLAAADHPLRVLDRDPALALLHEDDRDDDPERDDREEELLHRPAVDPGVHARAGADVRIEAKISSEMPLPMPRLVISSPIHISSVRAGGERDHDQHEAAGVDVQRVLALEEVRVADASARPRGRR